MMTENNPERLDRRWDFKRSLKELSHIREELASFLKSCDEIGRTEKDHNRMILCIDEAAANIVKYSSSLPPPHPPLTFAVTASIKDNFFQVRFEDNGTPFDPTKVPEIDMKEHILSGKKTGLGIHIIRTSLDIFKYEYIDGKNVFILGMKCKA